jgi:hypothetical protein
MKRNSLLLVAALALLSNAASASDQLFDNVVRHIETHYQVHREGRFVMAFAGLAIKSTHMAGVKNFKVAIFENQRFVNSESDTQFEQVVRSALNEEKGWQPVVQNFSHRTGERTYIYAQYLGKDMKLLVATVESNEAVVMQVKLNPDKMAAFIDENSHAHMGSSCHSMHNSGDEAMAREAMTDSSD